MSRALTFAAAAAFAVPALAQDRQTGQTGDRDRPFQQSPDRQDRAGQDRAPQGRSATPRGGQEGDAAAVPAAALVRWATQNNQAEIELAQFAKTKSQNPAVQRFAQTMIDAHTKYGQKLDRAGEPMMNDARGNRRTSAFRGGAGGGAAAENGPGDLTGAGDELDNAAGRTGGAAAENEPGDLTGAGDELGGTAGAGLPQGKRNPYNEDGTGAGAGAGIRAGNGYATGVGNEFGVGTDAAGLQTPSGENAFDDGTGAGDRTANRPVSPATAGAGTAADVLAFRETLKKQCGKTLKEQFDRLTPNDFDKAYASQQIGAHLEMIDTLTLAEKQAEAQGNRDLARTFADGKQETAQHLTMAISLLNEVTPAKVD